MLHIKNITYRIGVRTLFEGASARIPEGKRIGLVGLNGSGKTTLFRLITGELELDGGSIDQRAKSTLGTVAQDAPRGAQSPIEAVLASDKERAALLKEADTTKDPHRIAAIHTRLIDIDAHSAESRAAVILSGLGFDEKMQNGSLDNLSGGWKVRVALASALFLEPDILMLDEPTNHLDLESVIWLTSYLRSYPHTLVVVSHDRELLNQVAENILYVKDGSLSMYSGGYDDFVEAQAQKQALLEAEKAKQDVQRKHLQAFVDRFRAKASKAKQAQSRVKALEKLKPIASITSGHRVRIDFPNPLAKASPLVKLDGVSVGYVPGQHILEDLHLSVFDEDRIALLGANGNGKTTLARLIANQLTPTEGEVVPAGKLKVGYFAQDHLEKLTESATALDEMKTAMPDSSPDKVRGWLGRFGFSQERADVLVSHLSGGEKTRLALALVALERPNLLILDEPTNHLDVDARDALIFGLNNFNGSVLLISHDRHLLEASCDQLWIVQDGTCKQFFGDMDDYRKLLLERRQSARRQAKNEQAEGEDPKVSRKDERRLAAEKREMLAPLKKRVESAEKELETLTAEKEDIDQQLSDPTIYEGPSEKITALTSRQKQLETLIEQAEETWLEAQAELEEFS